MHEFAWTAHHLDALWLDAEDAEYDSERALPEDPEDADAAADDPPAETGPPVPEGETSSDDDG